MFSFQYYILLFSLFSTTVRYMLHTIDSFREHPWDKKTTYLLYVDIVVGILRLALYIEFTLVMWSLHTFPLFIARPIYLSVRALKKAVRVSIFMISNLWASMRCRFS